MLRLIERIAHRRVAVSVLNEILKGFERGEGGTRRTRRRRARSAQRAAEADGVDSEMPNISSVPHALLDDNTSNPNAPYDEELSLQAYDLQGLLHLLGMDREQVAREWIWDN